MTEQATQAIELQDIIDTRPDPTPAWIASPWGKFQVLARPIGNRHQEFIEQAQYIDWDTATMTRIVKTDQEKYARLFCDWVILNWKGLTPEILKKLVLINNPRKLARHKAEIACDAGASLLLFQHSQHFRAWIKGVANDVEHFNREREEQAEKK